MRTWSPAARRRSRACSSTWRTASGGWFASTTWSASTRSPGVSFDQKDGVNIMKGYMESGEFSRGRESIRADGSIVMVGNFDVDVQHQQRVGHLFGPLPPEMRNDTAFMDRIHAYLPGLGHPEGEQGSVHRPLRPGQRRPGGVLFPAADAKPDQRASRTSSLRRGPVGPRPERGQQDGLRPAEAALSRSHASRCRTRTWSGPSGWRSKSVVGSRNSRSASAQPSSETRSSATPWGSTASRSSSPRPSSRVKTASAPIHCPQARFGPSAQAARTRQPDSTASR